MKKITFYLIFIFSVVVPSLAQQDTIYFNSNSGNYSVQYIDKLPYAKKSDGTLRKLNFDSEIFNDEIYIEVDSLVVLEFVPATKINPSIKANVKKDSISNHFEYTYTISNGVSSVQNLIYFYLLFNTDSIEARNTEDTWWNRRQKQIKNGTLSNSNIWFWAGENGLEPNSQNAGFIISANGLPTINNSYFQGHTPTFGYPGTIPSSKITRELASLKSFPTNFVSRQTISPNSITTPFIHLEFLDTLISYSNSSYVLGWIQNQETRDKYKTYFNNASNYLEQGDSSAARNELQIVLNECNADSSTVLTTEAYALLRYNTEYLVEQLPAGVETIFKER